MTETHITDEGEAVEISQRCAWFVSYSVINGADFGGGNRIVYSDFSIILGIAQIRQLEHLIKQEAGSEIAKSGFGPNFKIVLNFYQREVHADLPGTIRKAPTGLRRIY